MIGLSYSMIIVCTYMKPILRMVAYFQVEFLMLFTRIACISLFWFSPCYFTCIMIKINFELWVVELWVVEFKDLMFSEFLLLRCHCILVELLYICFTLFVLIWFVPGYCGLSVVLAWMRQEVVTKFLFYGLLWIVLLKLRIWWKGSLLLWYIKIELGLIDSNDGWMLVQWFYAKMS